MSEYSRSTSVRPLRFPQPTCRYLPCGTWTIDRWPHGQTGRPVEIAYWRADWQATLNGRKDTIQALYPNATVDHYPFEARSLTPGSDEQQQMARRYAPADAVGNKRGFNLSPLAPGYSIPSIIANELLEADYELYESALVELGLVLLLVSIAVNSLARLLIWRMGRQASNAFVYGC